jgi:hypothetical protein
MKHYWRNDRVRAINATNVLEHINFLNQYNGSQYSALTNHANAFYNITSTSSYFGAIVTQYNLLGLYELNDDNTIKLSETAQMIVGNNALVNDFLEYFLIKLQFPRPHLNYQENTTVPFLIILKILLLLHQQDPTFSYLTKKEFYHLFNENAPRLNLNSIDIVFINNLLQNNRAWGLNQPAIVGTDDLNYDKTLFCNSQFLISDRSLYNNRVDFFIGLNPESDKIKFANFILNQHSNSFFNYDQASTNSDYKRTIKNEYSKFTNNKINFLQYLNQKNMIQHIDAFKSFCSVQGFHFSDDLIRRFLISLTAKPFLLLTGISGTGKSKIAELFGEFLTANNLGSAEIIAVESNWNDNRKLLGYWNPIIGGGTYFSTSVVDFIKIANATPAKIFIFLLDEMNLSYTERYFSDFLSALESRTKEITLPDQTNIYWSDNLKIIGTINEDETTHTLSPKVIDRSNIIEMNGDRPYEYLGSLIERNDPKVNDLISKNWSADFISLLDSIYLACGRRFGYRLMDEVMKYVILNVNLTGLDYKLYMDEQVYQKVLPKIHGTRGEIKDVLQQLQALFATVGFTNSKNKIDKMVAQLSATGFTSFVTA